MFWAVVGASAVASASLFAAIYAYWKYFPHTRHQRRVNDLKALRDLLLYHVDDLEDILEALQKRPELAAGRSSPHGGFLHRKARLCFLEGCVDMKLLWRRSQISLPGGAVVP